MCNAFQGHAGGTHGGSAEPPERRRYSLDGGICQNHPFLDGNRLAAYVVCRVFLILKGQDLDATREEKYLTLIRLARGEIPEGDLSTWIRRNLVPA